MNFQTTYVPYSLRDIDLNFSGIDIKLAVLENLDKTIDEICKKIDAEKAAQGTHGGGRELFDEDLCPYFGVLWPSAYALTEHLSRMKDWLKGKTVLEIGCGLALPSLVAAKMGAKVLATDFHPDVPMFLEKNMRQNDVDIEYRSLNWREEHKELGTFDFVIGSDILYENTHAEDVAKTLASHCHKDSHIIVADPGRSYLQQFCDAVKKQSFRQDLFIKNVPDTSGKDMASESKDIFLFSFQKV